MAGTINPLPLLSRSRVQKGKGAPPCASVKDFLSLSFRRFMRSGIRADERGEGILRTILAGGRAPNLFREEGEQFLLLRTLGCGACCGAAPARTRSARQFQVDSTWRSAVNISV